MAAREFSRVSIKMIILLAVSLVCCGYIDPGSGSMMFQAFLAVIAAITMYLGIVKGLFKSLWLKIAGRKKDDDTDK